VALDITTRFLSDLAVIGIEVVEADVRKAPIERETFDLVHARFVLIHIAHWWTALGAMIKALKPGGWLVLEEPDFSSARSFAGPDELRQAFESVNKSIEAMFSQRGMNHAFGVRIPSLLEKRMIQNICIENDASIERGGSPVAKILRLSTRQLQEKYIATGIASDEDIKLYDAFTHDPTCWAIYHGTVRGVGCKPNARRNPS
jgi:SAM-dependent methyltransferase